LSSSNSIGIYRFFALKYAYKYPGAKKISVIKPIKMFLKTTNIMPPTSNCKIKVQIIINPTVGENLEETEILETLPRTIFDAIIGARNMLKLAITAGMLIPIFKPRLPPIIAKANTRFSIFEINPKT
jgi:hypothetical protein